MGDPTTYMVSNNPIASAFGGQDDEFFNSIGQDNSSEHMNVQDPQMYNPEAMHQQYAQYSVYDQPIVGDQETYLPGQGPDTRAQQSQVEPEGIMDNSNSNPVFEQQQEGHVDSQLPKVSSSEDSVPPPPTSFQNQQHPGGFESISSVKRQSGGGATQNAFAPPQSFGYGVAQEHEQVVEEEDGVSSGRDSVPKGRLNPSLEAGRRKLEEFKRKKAAVLSRRSSITSSHYNDSGANADVLEARLQEAQEEVRKMKATVDRLTEEVEASREEKHAMEREKAALLGELVSIKASVEDSGSSSKAIELLREELDAMKDRTDGLEASLASSRGECNVLSEEKARLEEELNTLKVNSALTMRDDGELNRVKTELESLKSHHASLQAELEHQSVQTLQLQSQLADALNQEQGAREEVEEAKENIDSLRELLSEGEQERVELVSQLASLKSELAQMQQQEHAVQAHNDAAKDDEIRMLQAQLVDTERIAAEWREKAQQPVSTEVPYQQPQYSPTSTSENALQVRLAKAEAAVESERRAYQDLQHKIQDMENAMHENAALKTHMTELRQREEYLEQQIQSLQAQLQNGPSSGGGHPAMVADLEQRATAAENKAHSLEIDLAEATSTITRLSSEVNDLINRLKEQSSTIVELRQQAEVFESVPISDGQPPAEEPHPTPPAAPFHQAPIQQFNQQREEIVPEQQQQQQQQQQQEQSLFDTFTAPLQQQQQHITPQPWSVPGGVVETFPHQEAIPDAEAPPKKVGFWQWVAGADLASHE